MAGVNKIVFNVPLFASRSITDLTLVISDREKTKKAVLLGSEAGKPWSKAYYREYSYTDLATVTALNDLTTQVNDMEIEVIQNASDITDLKTNGTGGTDTALRKDLTDFENQMLEASVSGAASCYATASEDIVLLSTKSTIALDNLVQVTDKQIQIDKSRKAIGLKSGPTADPNVTGGDLFVIIATWKRITPSGNIPPVAMVLTLRDAVTNKVMQTIDGHSCQWDFDPTKINQGIYPVAIRVKGTQLIQYELSSDEITQMEFDGRHCGLLVQEITVTQTTSLALLQWQEDYRTFATIDQGYLSFIAGADTDLSHLPVTQQPNQTVIMANAVKNEGDGLYFSSTSGLNIDKQLAGGWYFETKDDGTNGPGAFQIGFILPAEKVQKLWRELLHVDLKYRCSDDMTIYFLSSNQDYVPGDTPMKFQSGSWGYNAQWQLVSKSSHAPAGGTQFNTEDVAVTVPWGVKHYAIVFASPSPSADFILELMRFNLLVSPKQYVDVLLAEKHVGPDVVKYDYAPDSTNPPVFLASDGYIFETQHKNTIGVRYDIRDDESVEIPWGFRIKTADNSSKLTQHLEFFDRHPSKTSAVVPIPTVNWGEGSIRAEVDAKIIVASTASIATGPAIAKGQSAYVTMYLTDLDTGQEVSSTREVTYGPAREVAFDFELFVDHGTKLSMRATAVGSYDVVGHELAYMEATDTLKLIHNNVVLEPVVPTDATVSSALFQMTEMMRYSIGKNVSPMPVGLKVSGDAPVEYDPSVAKVIGTQDAPGHGEGGMKVTQDGSMVIETSVHLYPGEQLPINKFAYVVFQLNNSRSKAYTKHLRMADSHTPQRWETFTTTFDVMAGDIITMTATATVPSVTPTPDGSLAFLYNQHHHSLEHKVTFYGVSSTLPVV